MKKLIKYWNQNRGKIILTLAIIAFIIFLIQLTNSFFRNKEKEKEAKQNIDLFKPVQSVITGDVVPEKITDENTEIIDSFIKFCNNKDYEQAFNILSSACREVVFNNDINIFKESYCNKIFTTTKTYALDLWMNTNNKYTYQIKYYDDNLLATGGGNMEDNTEDYVTIIKENDEEKLNINGFIQMNSINKATKKNDIEIIINSKIVYKNYETYDVTIRNYTTSTIMINDGQNSDKVCILDDRNVEFESFIHEIPIENLTLKSRYEKHIKIRFNKIYNLNRNIGKMRFKDIILNYEEYKTNPMSENIQKVSIDVDI